MQSANPNLLHANSTPYNGNPVYNNQINQNEDS